MKNRFLTIMSDNTVRSGIIKGKENCYIDLLEHRQSLTTNPSTSLFIESNGIKWDFMSEGLGGDYICDDDDGYLWYNCPIESDDGDELVNQIDLIDKGEFGYSVCINIKDMTYYHKGNGSFEDIK